MIEDKILLTMGITDDISKRIRELDNVDTPNLMAVDSSEGIMYQMVKRQDGRVCAIVFENGTLTLRPPNSTIPFTWAVGDSIIGLITTLNVEIKPKITYLCKYCTTNLHYASSCPYLLKGIDES